MAQLSTGSCRLFASHPHLDLGRVYSESQDDSAKEIVQNDRHDMEIWARGGVGNCHFGLAGAWSFACSFKSIVASVRYISASEFRLGSDASTFEKPELSCRELGVLLGITFTEKNVVVWSCSAGFGILSAVDRGGVTNELKKEYSKIEIKGACIPFEASLRIKIWHFGIGGSLFGNVNATKSFLGWMIDLYLGEFPI
jgi:hypothetical protein